MPLQTSLPTSVTQQCCFMFPSVLVPQICVSPHFNVLRSISQTSENAVQDPGKRRNSAPLQPLAPRLPPIAHGLCVPQRTSSRKNSCQGGERYPALGANHLEVEDCGIPRSRSRTSQPRDHMGTKPSGKCTGHCHT